MAARGLSVWHLTVWRGGQVAVVLAGLLLCSVSWAERQQLAAAKTDRPPVIDGALDDACWQSAGRIEVTALREADAGIPATTVQAVYTDEAVYFTFTCLEPRVAHLSKGSAGIGEPWHHDAVELFLDTDADMKNYVQMGITAGLTYQVNLCAQPNDCEAISGNWAFKSAILDDRYTVEIELPFDQFPIDRQPLTATWNVAFTRTRKVDLEKHQLAVWKGYLMEGRHHQPKTWGDLGPFEVNFATIGQKVEKTAGPGGWEYPAGIPATYVPNFPAELDPSLAWVKTERLRIAWSWLTSPVRYIDNAQHQHTFQQMVEVVVPAGFNVVIPAGAVKPKQWTPYRLWAALDAMIRVRLAGARTMLGLGYLSGWDAMGQDPDRRLARYVGPNGMRDDKIMCPLEPFRWRNVLAPAVLDALAEAERLGVPDLFFGVFFDIEPEASMGTHVGDSHAHCYCDACWSRYRGIQPDVPATLSASERKDWLVSHEKLDPYKAWQKQQVTELVRLELEPIRQMAPALVLGFYPYHQGLSWMTEAVFAGISTRRAPGITMDDQTYWSGYTGKPDYVDRKRRETIAMLGYEPFYLASIDYAEPLPEFGGRYPSYTLDRAGREQYLMVKNAIGNIAYAGSRRPDKDLLEDQREYYVEAFTKAHKLLVAEGIIDQAAPKAPTGEERQRLEKAQAILQQEIVQMWGTVHAQAREWVDTPTSGTFVDGVPVRITKEVKQKRLYVWNGASLGFELELDAQPKAAKVIVTATARRHCEDRTNVLVKVNGTKVAYVRDGFVDGSKTFEVSFDPRLVEPTTVVELAYFLGDSFAETRFDNFLLIDSVTLCLE